MRHSGRFLGQSEGIHQDAKGRPLDEVLVILNEHTRVSVESPLRRVLAERAVVGLANHALLVARDGTEHPIADSGAPVFDTNRTLVGVVLVFRDQTDERHALAEIRQTEERFRTFFDNAPIGKSMTRPDGQLHRVNPALCAMLGYSAEELQQRTFASITHPDDLADSVESVRAVLSGERSGWMADKRLIAKDGHLVWAHVSAVLQRDDDGTPLHLMTHFMDITDRKRTARAMEDLARFPAENPSPVLRLRPDGMLMYANAGACALLRHWNAELGQRAPDEICAFVTEAIAAGAPGEHEMDASGRSYLLRIAPIPAAGYVNIYGTDVTALKRSEAKVRESEVLYRSLFDAMMNGGAHCRVLFDEGRPVDFVYLNVNRAFEQQTGLKNVEGRKVSDVIPGIRESDPWVFEVYERVAITGKPERFETYVRALDMWFAVSVHSPAREHFVAVFDVITERKRAEVALRQREEQLRAALDTTPFPVALVDVEDNQIRFWSKSAVEIFGHTAPTVPEWFALAHPDPEHRQEVVDRWNLALEQARRSGQAANAGECRVTCRDGSVRICEVYARFLEDLLVATFSDITYRKQAEEAMRKSEQRLQQQAAELEAVFSAHAESIIVYNADAMAVRANGAARALLGFDPVGKRLGQNMQNSGTPGEPDSSATARALRGETVVGAPFDYAGPDGLHHALLTSSAPIRSEAGQVVGAVTVAHDITDHKRAEEDRARLKEQLLAAQKMEAVGSLASGIAHDFNNLISVIMNYCSFALDEAPEGGSLRDDLIQINTAAERAARLTAQLLAFGRKQILRPESIDLNRIVSEMQKMLQRIIGEDIEVVHLLSSDLGVVCVDPSQLEQVIMNLAVNARDAMSNGGRLTIETANVHLEGYTAGHIGVDPGDYVMLAISDTGCGMDETTRARTLEPFFTTKAAGKGTGLGLATVYGIVKQSGGNIAVGSEPGQGTVFKRVEIRSGRRECASGSWKSPSPVRSRDRPMPTSAELNSHCQQRLQRCSTNSARLTPWVDSDPFKIYLPRPGPGRIRRQPGGVGCPTGVSLAIRRRRFTRRRERRYPAST